MERYIMAFITTNALHVSGGSSAHHQELKTVYTASGVCRAFSASYRYRESHKKQKKLDKYPMLGIVLSSWWWAEEPPETCRAFIVINTIV